MEAVIGGIEILLNWQVLLALFVGSVGGVIIGAIPGVGAPTAIAILLPATFSMEPVVGLTMLLGIYGSSMYGGAIPAVPRRCSPPPSAWSRPFRRCCSTRREPRSMP